MRCHGAIRRWQLEEQENNHYDQGYNEPLQLLGNSLGKDWIIG
jgi:hypothetical protein